MLFNHVLLVRENGHRQSRQRYLFSDLYTLRDLHRGQWRCVPNNIFFTIFFIWHSLGIYLNLYIGADLFLLIVDTILLSIFCNFVNLFQLL